MKHVRIALLVTALTAALSTPAGALEAGAPAPELPSDGVNLASLKGKVVYVDFWASWCGPCRQSFPFMNDLQQRYGAKGLEVIAVNVDAKREDADRFLGQYPARFTVAYDAKGEFAKRFEVKAMPSSVLVGRDGRIVELHKGFREDERQELEARIARALEMR